MINKQEYRTVLNNGMETLKNSLSLLIEKLPAGVPIVYLDNPIHLNIGDLLINKGLENLLAAHDRHIIHRINAKDYKRFLHLIKDEHTLLLHGGGNFGDIWPVHEDLRQEVVGRFKRNKIVLFPQTVHFNNTQKIEKYAKVYQEHPDFFMFLRDTRSYNFIKDQLGIPCALAPDTAHFLWQDNQFTPDDSGKGEMIFMRRDVEASADNQKDSAIDWETLISKFDYMKFRLIDGTMRVNRLEFLQPMLQKMWYKHRDHMIVKSITYFNHYEHIKSDRLHALILGSLLGKKVTLKDNNYGKLTTYCDSWMNWIIRSIMIVYGCQWTLQNNLSWFSK